MEPLKPELKQALRSAHQDLTEDHLDRYEELLAQRFSIDPDEQPEEIARLDREREQLIQQYMPQFQEIQQRFSKQIVEQHAEQASMNAMRMPLETFGQKLAQSRNRRDGVIMLHLTGEEAGDWCLECSQSGVRVMPNKAEVAPLVEVTGNAKRIIAILEGRKEARKAFIAGGIRVCGDIAYLEALGRELGFIYDEVVLQK